MENFNAQYQEIVATYLQDIEELAVTNGVYKSDESPFRAAKSEYYQIPPEICELLEAGTIIKLHGYRIRIELKLLPKWHNSDMYLFNDQSFPHSSDPLICSTCGTDLVPLGFWWECGYEPVPVYKCDICYQNRDMTFREDCMVTLPYINFLDWVEFAKEKPENFGCKFYVNCNPNSQDYGKIMSNLNTMNMNGIMNIIYNDIHDMIADISEWIAYVPDSYSPPTPDDYAKFIDNNSNLMVYRGIELQTEDFLNIQPLQIPITNIVNEINRIRPIYGITEPYIRLLRYAIRNVKLTTYGKRTCIKNIIYKLNELNMYATEYASFGVWYKETYAINDDADSDSDDSSFW